MKKIMNKIKNNYNNLMNETKLGYYLRKTVSTKNVYLLFIIFGSLILLATYVSYALFTVAQEREKAFRIVVGNLISNMSSDELDEKNSIVVEANSSRIVTITLTNTNTVKAKYNLNYMVENNETNDAVTVKYVEVSQDKPNSDGQYVIDKASSDEHTKTIKLILENKTDIDHKVTFKSQVGLATATLKNDTNTKIIKDEFKYTYNSYADALSTTSIPYDLNDTQSKEFKLTYQENDSESFDMKVSKDSVYMDVSETLDSQDVNVSYKSNFASGQDENYEIYIEHPQTKNSLAETDTVSTVLGQTNLINIQNYFTFTNPNTNFTKTSAFGYEDATPFQLIGNIKDQTKTMNGQIITLGFYGYYKYTGDNAYTNHFYDETKFSVTKEGETYNIPSFKLYTYNKQAFKSDIEKLKTKLYDYDPSYYKIQDYIKKINETITNLYNKRKVTQLQLDEAIAELKKGPEHLKADYTKLNEVLQSIDTMDGNAYTEESWNALQEAKNKVIKDLYKEDQKKVDQFTKDIETAIHDLKTKLKDLRILFSLYSNHGP